MKKAGRALARSGLPALLLLAGLAGACTARFPGSGAPVAATPAEQALAGAWTGHFESPLYSRLIDFTFARAASGAWSVEARFAVAAGQAVLPVEDLTVNGGRVSFQALLSGARFRFEGGFTGDELGGTLSIELDRGLLGALDLQQGTWRLRKRNPFPLPAPQVLDRVRQALRYGQLAGLPHGFSVEERSEAESVADAGSWYRFDPSGRFLRKRGAFGEALEGFDGQMVWTRLPDGTPAVPRARQAEQIRLQAALRSFRWLEPGGDLSARVLGISQTGRDSSVVLLVHAPGGEVGARLYLDPQTWLPERAEVERQRGLQELAFGAYRDTLGFRYPGRIRESATEAGSPVVRLVTVRPLPAPPDAGVFAMPEAPYEVIFEPAQPGKIEMKTGPGGHPFVRGSVGGQALRWWLVDSGSSGMWIDSGVADALGLPIVGRFPNGETLRPVDTLRIGPVLVRDMVFYARDLSAYTDPDGRPCAGMIGYPLLRSVVAEFDFASETLAFYDPAAYRLDRGAWEDLIVEVLPMVPARFDGGEGLFRLDTGKSGAVTFYPDFIQAHGLVRNRRLGRGRTRTAYGQAVELVGRVQWFVLGGRRFKNVPATFKLPGTFNSDRAEAGIIGRDLLRHFVVVFDYSGERIAFLKR